jgi:hypothetical protein
MRVLDMRTVAEQPKAGRAVPSALMDLPQVDCRAMFTSISATPLVPLGLEVGCPGIDVEA